jgi:hypothetical protein
MYTSGLCLLEGMLMDTIALGRPTWSWKEILSFSRLPHPGSTRQLLALHALFSRWASTYCCPMVEAIVYQFVVVVPGTK